MNRRRTIFAFLVVVISFAAVSTMGDIFMPTIAKTEAGVTLYGITRHDATIYTKYTNAFVAKFPEVSNILWLERTQVSAWRSAIESGSNPVSILWGGGPTIFNILADEGLMSPFQDTDLVSYIQNNINQTIAGADMLRYNETTGDILWAAAAISSFGFTVNHKNLDNYGLPVPQTWEDLASPIYYLGTTQHALGMGDAPETTSNTRVYQIILQKFGWEAGWDIITRMAGNAKIFEGGSGPTRDSVITGSQAVAMTIDFYGYQAQAQNPDCEYIIPKNESIVNADPIAIASSTPYKSYAEEFVKFVLSAEGQAMWLDTDINRLPVIYEAFDYAKTNFGNDRSDLAEAFNNTVSEAGIPFNETLARSIYDIVTFYFQGALTKSATQLYSAWDKLVKAYRDDKAISTEEYRSISRYMSEPQISLEEAKTLQALYEDDPSMKDSLVTGYTSYASNKYNKVGNKILSESNDADNDGQYFDEFKVTITSPTLNSVVDGLVNISITVVEYGSWNFLYGVSHVVFEIDSKVIGNDTTKPFSAVWDTTKDSDGSHNLKVTAYEVSGRSTFSQINLYAREEVDLPDASITSPQDGATINGTVTITISAQETTEFQIDKIEVTITNPEGETVYSKTITENFDSISLSWNTFKDATGDGTYKITVTIHYSSGNTKSIGATVTLSNGAVTWKSPGFELIPVLLGFLALIPIIILRRKH
ncbi:MAG: extracellular solute-binding protein [Candidatus Hodarchaeales archaeon]